MGAEAGIVSVVGVTKQCGQLTLWMLSFQVAQTGFCYIVAT